jgi:hypothetical protein
MLGPCHQHIHHTRPLVYAASPPILKLSQYVYSQRLTQSYELSRATQAVPYKVGWHAIRHPRQMVQNMTRGQTSPAHRLHKTRHSILRARTPTTRKYLAVHARHAPPTARLLTEDDVRTSSWAVKPTGRSSPVFCSSSSSSSSMTKGNKDRLQQASCTVCYNHRDPLLQLPV